MAAYKFNFIGLNTLAECRNSGIDKRLQPSLLVGSPDVRPVVVALFNVERC